MYGTPAPGWNKVDGEGRADLGLGEEATLGATEGEMPQTSDTKSLPMRAGFAPLKKLFNHKVNNNSQSEADSS